MRLSEEVVSLLSSVDWSSDAKTRKTQAESIEPLLFDVYVRHIKRALFANKR